MKSVPEVTINKVETFEISIGGNPFWILSTEEVYALYNKLAEMLVRTTGLEFTPSVKLPEEG